VSVQYSLHYLLLEKLIIYQ